MEFPFDIPFVIIDVTNTKGYVGEIDSTFVSTEEMPCKDYSLLTNLIKYHVHHPLLMATVCSEKVDS